jgi:hypothetical protein
MGLTRLLVRRCSRRSRALDDLLEEIGPAEQRDAMLAQDVEDLVDECLQVNILADRAWNGLLDAIVQGEKVDFEAVDASLGIALPRLAHCFERVLRFAVESRERGFRMTREGELRAALQAVRNINTEYERLWAVNGDALALSQRPLELSQEPDSGPVIPHTERPRSIAEMAAELDRVSRPISL